MREKRLDLTFVRFCNGNTNILNRNENAKRYLHKKAKRKSEIISSFIIIFIVVILLIGVCIKIKNTEPRYAIARETKNNGNYYVYVTECVCEVTEITQDYVTVSYNGNYYNFFGCDYKVGQEIICQFTDDMKIVGVIE